MIRFFRDRGARAAERGEFWLAGQFDRKANPFADPAIAAWSEILGREQARLWMTARANEGRGR
jgi:hypothetical protein